MKQIFINFFLIFFTGITYAQYRPIILEPNGKPVVPPQLPAKIMEKYIDRDGDGVLDSYDRCPDEKGEKRNFGCPPSKQIYYPVVTIGNQVWMQNNLNTDRFRNGDLIPEAKSNEEWKRLGEERKPAWCFYENDSTKGVVYGKL